MVAMTVVLHSWPFILNRPFAAIDHVANFPLATKLWCASEPDIHWQQCRLTKGSVTTPRLYIDCFYRWFSTWNTIFCSLFAISFYISLEKKLFWSWSFVWSKLSVYGHFIPRPFRSKNKVISLLSWIKNNFLVRSEITYTWNEMTGYREINVRMFEQ